LPDLLRGPQGRALLAVLAAGLLIRLPLLAASGFATDTSTFESWALTLAAHPLRAFYASAGFADYPPGYFYVLWLVGHAYAAFVHGDPQYTTLRTLVKLPAVLADLACGGLTFAIARRIGNGRWALAAAAVFVFNPAAIFISAYWGQVDSFAAVFTLIAILLALEAGRMRGARTVLALTLAWTALGYSLLIKPPAAILAALLIAFVFRTRDAGVRRTRALGTACGVLAAGTLAYVSAVPFHADVSPLRIFGWLLERYRYGSAVYPYNSINAFNVYAVARHFWSPDVGLVPGWVLGGATIGVPQYGLGIGLVLTAAAVVLASYLRSADESDARFVEAAMLLSLAFFVLATRMHERYVFNAFLLCMPLVGVGRRYAYAALLLSTTLFANLLYALNYLAVVTARTPGVDATDLLPLVSRPLSLVNVLVLVMLAYVYLGGETIVERNERTARVAGDSADLAAEQPTARPGSPLEGLQGMTRLDHALASGWTLASFVVTFVGFDVPGTKIFDEIYYARAAEEYIRRVDIFEFTHPPLTKLVITLSTMLFGDRAFGWRFLDLVVGALTVYVLYAFAKRLTGSTPFAAIAAGMLVFDGFHYVQSRIATPEITVSFFALLALYAFYRYWIATQIRVAPQLTARLVRSEALVFGIGSLFALGGVALFAHDQSGAARTVLVVYLELGAYLLARLVTPAFVRGPLLVSYADGTAFVRETPPVASREGAWALLALTLSCGCLAASKWNGLFDFVVVWLIVVVVVSQPAWPHVRRALGFRGGDLPAAFGNPRGFSPDVVVAAMLFVAATIYVLTYVPYFALGHSLGDLVGLQHQMYAYHYNLHATHPYSSVWWQWPLLQIPVSYYYTDFRAGAAATDPHACCVAEILALPNPAIWWSGLLSVPFVGYLAWRERCKGYVLLVVAYLVQWLPWAISPRLTFEYHFYPNLAIIVLSDTMLLQRLWMRGGRLSFERALVVGFLVLAVAAFAYWYPILAGTHLRWDAWHARMWTGLEGNNWINPHPGR